MATLKKKTMTSEMIRNVYGKKYRLDSGEIVGLDDHSFAWPEIFANLREKNLFTGITKKQKIFLVMMLTSILLLIKAFLLIYYYNVLVDAEQNTLAATADVQALIQRRNDMANNLFKAVNDYSKYEQQVFTSVVSLRTLLSDDVIAKRPQLKELRQTLASQDIINGGAAEAKAGDAASPPAGKNLNPDLLSSFSKLMAVAEQYPDLKLSANVASMMAALIQVETDLAAQRITYNHMASIYTTYTVKFPSNVFAWIYQFEPQFYFDASDEAKSFSRIGN